MKPTLVKVPASLLMDRRLSSSAKLLWEIYQLVPNEQRTRVVRECSGVARNTIRSALDQLKALGWLRPSGAAAVQPSAQDLVAPPTFAILPSDLLLDQQVGRQAKLLYGCIQFTAGCRGPSGQTTYRELSDLMGLSEKPVRTAFRQLAQRGWLHVEQPHKFAPIRFTLANPVETLREWDALAAQRRLEMAPFRGEALMREYLSLLVQSDQFEDDATPGFLINPYTDEELQFDRFYPPGVAFEFNGPQHYAPTALYAKEADFRNQQARDLMKIGLCSVRGITLVIVHPQDLSLKMMREKVTGLLPVRDLDGHEPLIAFLEREGRAHRRRAAAPHRTGT